VHWPFALAMIYEQMPEHFVSKFETAACFLEHEGAFLMLKRALAKPFGGTWCLPDGKRDGDESLQDCAKRETLEETEILLDDAAITHLKTVYVENAGLQFTYHMFKVSVPKRPMPRLNSAEHSEYVWTSPRQALGMNLIPGQDDCVRLVYRV
jgi:8-oxo-dGTP pyrophosphatase MutT (NUDIX family)